MGQIAPITTQGLVPAEAPQATPAATAGFADALRAKVGEVAASRTPLTGSQAASALRSAFRARYGHEPSDKTVAILGAQWSLETGGGRSMMNYNFGGIKGASPSGQSTRYGTVEGSGAGEQHIVDRFRAYGSAAEGASDYLQVLEKRFPSAFGMARAGDAKAFVHELKRAGYFTGSEEQYTHIVTDLAARAERDGFDVLGKGGGVTTAPAKAPGPTAPAAKPTVDALELELVRLSHAMDEAALGIMGAGDRGGGSPEWMQDLRTSLYDSRGIR